MVFLAEDKAISFFSSRVFGLCCLLGDFFPGCFGVPQGFPL